MDVSLKLWASGQSTIVPVLQRQISPKTRLEKKPSSFELEMGQLQFLDCSGWHHIVYYLQNRC